MAADRLETLHGRWVHSHEEDTAGETIFRPAAHRFPPSRGRTSVDLRSDGTYVESYPGPVDVPEQSIGRWSLAGDRLVLTAQDERPDRAWELVDSGPDRLVFRT